jgi:hypothetical protein
MATTRKYGRNALADYYVYAPLGAGQLLVEKSKEFGTKARKAAQDGLQAATRSYREMAERGEKLVSGIRRSAYTQRAVDQTKTASRQVKAAATSIRKAAGTTAEATKAATKKIG